MSINTKSIGFRIGFWSALALIILGLLMTSYAVTRMLSMAEVQRTEALASARRMLLRTAHGGAAEVNAFMEEPLITARTLASALVAAARPNLDRVTADDWERIRQRFQRMEIAADLAQAAITPYISAADSGEMTLEDAQHEALARVRAMRYDNGNYLWIHDLGTPVPTMLMHPILPELEGQRLDDPLFNTALDRDQNLFVAMNEACAETGSCYVHYRFVNPNADTDEQQPKLSHGRMIPQWRWMIGTGISIDQASFFSRDDINHILRSVLNENSNFLAVYTVWEPNAFDGQDSRFVDTEGHDASGRFIPFWSRNRDGAIMLEPALHYDTSGDGDYYQIPRRTRQEAVLNPYDYPIQGRTQRITSLVAPILRDGVFRGMVGVDIRVDGFADLVKAAAREIFDGQATVAIIANNGRVVAHSHDPSLVDQAMASLYDQGREMLNALNRGEVIQLETRTTAGAEELTTLVPIQIGETNTPWTFKVKVPLAMVTERADQAAAQARNSAITMVTISVIAVLAGGAVMLLLATTIVRRIKQISTALHDIAEGEGDLTRNLPTAGGDELADLATGFNRFQQRIRDLVQQVAGSTSRVAAAAEQLSASSDETNSHIRHQQAESEQVATAMNEMSATVAEVARNASQAAQAAQQADHDTQDGHSQMVEAVRLIQATTEEIEATTAAVMRLSNDTENIGKVLDVIRGIAEQTNLLALNAAIEAARAGEQGRGFAVVADEVRTLASRTQDSTKEIQAMIERLQGGSNTAVEAMEQARLKVKKNAEMAENANQILETIAGAVTHIRDMNTQIASATEEQTAVAEEVDRNLVSGAQAIEAIAAASLQINHSATELAQLAAKQLEQVNQFKV